MFLNKLYFLPNNFAFLSVRTVEVNIGESKLTASLNDSTTNSEFETISISKTSNTVLYSCTVHNEFIELYEYSTVRLTLTAVLRGCVR